MKLYLLLFVAFASVALSVAQDDNEEEVAPPAPSSSILARARARSLPGKPQAGPKSAPVEKLKKTTPAPPTSQPQNEGEIIDENGEQQQEEGDYIDENNESSSVKPTEPPKKLGQGSRPFRSNQDLLETLKRRREQRVPPAPISSTTSFTPVKQSDIPKSRINKSSKGNFSPTQEQVFDSSKKSSRNSFNRNNKVTTQSPQPFEEEEFEPTPAASKPRFGGRGGRRL